MSRRLSQRQLQLLLLTYNCQKSNLKFGLTDLEHMLSLLVHVAHTHTRRGQDLGRYPKLYDHDAALCGYKSGAPVVPTLELECELLRLSMTTMASTANSSSVKPT
jgi:hypothetical protein